MVKIKLTLQKPKKSQEIQVNSLAQVFEGIEKMFGIPSKNVKFMKPPLKDENNFLKLIKEGMQVIFMEKKKEKEKQEQETIKQKQSSMVKTQEGVEQQEKKSHQKKEEKKKEEKNQKTKLDAEKKKQILDDLKTNEHQKILKKLKKEEIVERGFEHMNEMNEVQDMGTQHFTCPVILMKCMPQFIDFARSYQVQPKNPDGLIIEDLYQTIKEVEGSKGGIIDPLDWTSSFIAYCGDDIDFPFPTYDFHYVITKIFTTIQNAIIVDQQRRQPNALPSKYNHLTNLVGIQTYLKKVKMTKIDEDDDEIGTQEFKSEFKFVVECDLTDPNVKKLEDGVKKRFEEKVVWQNFYAFDLEFLETIIKFERIPEYLFIHLNRFGYPPNKDEGQQIELSLNKKDKRRIRTKRILDIFDLAQNAFYDKLQAGRYERNNLFNNFQADEKYRQYVKDLESKGVDIKQYTQIQLKFMYFDTKLIDQLDIFHQYYFEPLKGSKATGQYRIVGMVLHKGEYFHHPDPTHTKQSKFEHDVTECRGSFKTMVYNKGKQWLSFEGAKIQRRTLDDALSEEYWGDGEWTPILLLYRQMMIRHMEIEAPDD